MVAAENGVKMAAEDVGSPRGVKMGVVEKADASENTGLKCGEGYKGTQTTSYYVVRRPSSTLY